MTNLARFVIEGSVGGVSASADKGYDAVASETLAFRLEGTSALARSFTVQVANATGGGPRASTGAPLLSLVGETTGQSVTATTPSSDITTAAPSSGTHAWIVRSLVNGGIGPLGVADPDYVFERIIVVRSLSGFRKIIGTEYDQYSTDGWSGAHNDVVDSNAFLFIDTSMESLRELAPVAGSIRATTVFSTEGDNGGGLWLGVTGASPGTYTHNGGTVIVPSGGDGSAAWLRQYSGPAFCEWFGASPDATGAANVTAIDAAISWAKTSGDNIAIGPGSFSVASTLLFDDMSGMSWTGAGQDDSLSTACTTLVWVGNNSTPCIRVQDSREMRIEGLRIEGSASYPLFAGLNFHWLGAGSVQYRCGAKNVLIDGGAGHLGRGVLINKDAGASDSNNSEHLFENVRAENYGTSGGTFTNPSGFYNDQPQAKACTYIHCGANGSTAGGGKYGYYGNASFKWIAGGGGNNRATDGCDFYLSSPNDPTAIDGHNSEGSAAFMRTAGYTNACGPTSIKNLRMDCQYLDSADLLIDFRFAGPFSMENCLVLGAPDDCFVKVGSNAGYAVRIVGNVIESNTHPLQLAAGLTGMPNVTFRNNETVDGSSYGVNWPDYVTHSASSTVVEPAGKTRPTGVSAGQVFYDTTIKRPVWFNGTVWTFQTGEQAYTPADFGSKILWLNPTEANVTVGGGVVTGFADDSGEGNDLVQGTSATFPTWADDVAALNGNPGIQGAAGATAEQLTISTFAGGSVAQPVSIFSVFTKSATAGAYVMDGVTGRIIVGDQTNVPSFFAGSWQSVSGTHSTGDLALYEMVVSGASSDLRVERAGETVQTVAANPGANAIDGVKLLNSNFIGAYFGELVLIEGALTDLQRKQLRDSYFRPKFEIWPDET